MTRCASAIDAFTVPMTWTVRFQSLQKRTPIHHPVDILLGQSSTWVLMFLHTSRFNIVMKACSIALPCEQGGKPFA